MSDLQRLNECRLTCNKCGACREVCPVFTQIGKESSVTRGRMALLESLLNNEIEPSEELALPFSQCLLCLACTKVCVNQVPIMELIPLVRGYLKEKLGRPRLEKFFFKHVLQSKTSMNSVVKGGSILQSLLSKPIPEDSGLRLRFPLYLDTRRRLPALSARCLDRDLSTINKGGQEKGRVAFFAGCMINYIYPEVGLNLVATLNRAGITVVFPKDQKCCGTPAFVNGDIESAYNLASDWIKSFSSLKDVEAIITACASCGSTLKETYAQLLNPDFWPAKSPREKSAIDDTWNKYRKLRPKLTDISQYLVKHLTSPNIFPAITGYGRVTYHDPCHLRRGLGVFQEPRELLKKVFGKSMVELANAGNCCGGGGTFSLYHYQLSRQINQKRIDDVEESQAELLVTNCPLCKAHLQDGCYQAGRKIKVVHLMDLFGDKGIGGD